jgi:hypothetical protein
MFLFQSTAFGDIDIGDFENVVLGMVSEIDQTLWTKRLEEKDRLHHEREAAKAQAEAERLRLEQGNAIIIVVINNF